MCILWHLFVYCVCISVWTTKIPLCIVLFASSLFEFRAILVKYKSHKTRSLCDRFDAYVFRLNFRFTTGSNNKPTLLSNDYITIIDCFSDRHRSANASYLSCFSMRSPFENFRGKLQCYNKRIFFFFKNNLSMKRNLQWALLRTSLNHRRIQWPIVLTLCGVHYSQPLIRLFRVLFAWCW